MCQFTCKGFQANTIQNCALSLQRFHISLVLQSDDSLGHLSAEEKACLLFLEETIESLDTEEDSGLSNDEPEQLPNPGNVATKLADLSASMKKINLNSQFISIDAHLPIEQSMKYFEEIYVVSLMTLFPYRFKDTDH